MLVGRDSELDELAHLIDEARSGGGAVLVIAGEPGIGKTVFLNEIASRANDFELVRVDGVESEFQLGYAGLHRILLPFWSRIGHLPDPQREALESAFGLGTSRPSDRFLVGLAALSLLGDIERTSPLLILVDDAHWLDRDSMAALAFLSRRLQGDRLALIFAVREGLPEPLPLEGLPTLHLAGLDPASAREFLASLVASPIRSRVTTEMIVAAHGNPLALRGFAEELSAFQLAGLASLPDPLPIGELIEARFARQLDTLPPEAQTILLLAAADPSKNPVTISKAAIELGASLTAFEPAERMRLITTEPRIEFSHSLVRSAVYSRATPAQKRTAHRALASVIDEAEDREQWATHRALAATGPDEAVALALEESAMHSRARGGYSAETDLLVRAAGLTPEPRHRSRRLLSAAHAAHRAGNSPFAATLLADAQAGELDRMDQAHAQLLDGMLRAHSGEPSQTPALLLKAAEAFAPLDKEQGRRALLSAFSALTSTLHLTDGVTGHELGEAALIALQGAPSNATVDTLLGALASLYVDDYEQAAPALYRAVLAFDHMTSDEVIEWYFVGPFIANHLWDSDAFRSITRRLEDAARQQGALFALRAALMTLGLRDTWEGQFAAASARYAELNDISSADAGGLSAVSDLLDVELVAWRGDEIEARTKIAAMLEIGSALQTGSLVLTAQLALATLEIGLGHYPEALAAAQAIEDSGAPSWSCHSLIMIVEAAMRCGDAEAAKNAYQKVIRQATTVQTPWALGALSLCRALVGEGSEPESSFQDAIERLEKVQWRTLSARVHLLYGEWLRRQRRRAEARTELLAAFAAFEVMGAKGFAERARLELQASGDRAGERHVEAAGDLTMRESQIARLAATRLTTREIASQLFISPYTVEYHLRKIFQKLGITSRRDLADAMPTLNSEL